MTSIHTIQTAIVFRIPGQTLLDFRRTPRGSKDVRLTDHEVELVRQVYEMGGISLRELADKFEVSKQHIHDIVTFRRRPYAA
jgi:predicted DNA binding protein